MGVARYVHVGGRKGRAILHTEAESWHDACVAEDEAEGGAQHGVATDILGAMSAWQGEATARALSWCKETVARCVRT